MWYKIIMVLLMVTTIGFSQNLGNWRWNNEQLDWAHDKEAHFAGSFGLYYLFKYKGSSDFDAAKYSFYLGLVKETIDALVPYESYGAWGGDGWSNADIQANLFGIGTAYVIDRLWESKSYENKSASIKIHSGHIWVNIYFN